MAGNENEAEVKKITELDFGVKKATDALDTINDKLKKIADESEKYAEKIGKNLGSTLDVGKYIDSNSTAKSMQEITDKVVKNDKVAQRQIVVNHQASLDKRLENQEKHEQRIAEINARQLKSTKTLYGKVAEYAKTYLIYQGFNQLKSGIEDTVNEMVEVESQMIAIERVMEEGSIVVEDYRDKLIQLAYDYGNSFENVADITLRLAQAGFDANEALALTEKTLLALNTAELNATQATSDMVAVMAQWGLMTGTTKEQSDAYGEIIDKINIVADRFPTTSEDIMNALKKTSSAFKIAGADMDETIATIVAAETASQRGGKAIGTALSNISQQLKETSRIDIAKDLGISFYTDETETEYKDLMVILQELSDKMQQLKDEGKESSVEMQELLSVFTVFRRNIGASLLGEMAGEDNTYAQVLSTLNESLGYSIKENEKYMRSAEAAQQQFNATLLELKTAIWDGGLEDVFRSMLMLGTNLTEGITVLVEKFGALPVAAGLAVGAFSLLNKEMRLYKTVSVTMADGTKTNIKMLNDWVLKLRTAFTEVKTLDNGNKKIVTSLSAFAKNLKGVASAEGAAAAQAVVLEAKTLALQALYSVGLSLAITAVVSLFDKLIHAQENAAKAAEEANNKLKEQITKYQEEAENIDELVKSYEELNAVAEEQRTSEQQEKIKKLQMDITAQLKEQKQYTQDLNDNYDEQIRKLKEISEEKREQMIMDQRTLLQNAKTAAAPESFSNFDNLFGKVTKPLEKQGFDYNYFKSINEKFGNIYMGDNETPGGIMAVLDSATFEEQVQILTDMTNKLTEASEAGENVGESLAYVSGKLENIREKQDAVTEAQDKLNSMLEADAVLSDYDIQNMEDYVEVLGLIPELSEMPEGYSGTLEEYKQNITDLVKESFPEYEKASEDAKNGTKDFMSVVDKQLEQLQKYGEKYSAVTNAVKEYNDAGMLSVGTLQNLIDNNLLQYLDFQNGKLVANTQALDALAEATRISAIENLQQAATQDIQNLAMGKTENLSLVAKGAIAQFGDAATETGNESATATAKIATMAQALQDVIDASKGNLSEGINVADFQAKANAIANSYKNIAVNIGKLSLGKISKGTSSGSRGSSSASRAAEDAAKAEEEAYKKRLKAFTDYVKEMERLEKRWTDKQRSLGVLTAEDEKYVIQQRIKRYEQYLQEVKEMTWLNAEDRLELEKEYTEEIEDLQMDYLDLLKDQLDDQLDALKDANEKKIELIEEEADKRIEALKKVEDENDRIRAKEEYLRKRQEHLDDISYWEQRTGREAQEALLEARKKLEELDNEWQQQLEDWDIEDQIAAIEAERDAQIEAIKAAEEAEIASMQNIYDEKVKLFSETGQIIYDNSVIQSQALYEAYKKNFIDPIMSDLNNLNNSSNTAASSAGGQYESYTVQRGDTLSKIAKKYSTTVEKIMAANPSIKNKNKIYTGNTIQIPKFHNGGIVGGNQEGFALLKPQEVVLKTEWAESLNRMMRYFDGITAGNINGFTNNPVIEVKGNLIQIDADIKNKSDVDYLERKIEKMLKSKFNIKK